MSTRSPWLKFSRLLQGEGRSVVTVQSNNDDGTSTVATRDGTVITVKGENEQAMIEDGRLVHEVSALSSSVVEI